MDALSRNGALAGRLARGDRRVEGDAPSVAADVTANPGKLPELIACLFDADPSVRMRAADSLERVSRGNPGWLDPHIEHLLTDAVAIEQAEVRWHLAQTMPRLTLNDDQRHRAAVLLADWFENSPSRIVKASALQAVVDLAERDPELRATAAEMLGRAMRSDVPSLAERARRILKPFEVDAATLSAALAPREHSGLTLSVLPERLAVAQLPPEEGLPSWLDWTDPLVGATRTGEELSILCREDRVPDHVRAQKGWRAFKVEGPLDFSLFGVLARIAVPLAQAHVPIFAISTYDTEYVLVRADDLDRAAEVLAQICTVVRKDA
ncbi:ACT domain-containing protein [Azospirillum doebereinerae]|uniref:ACT domain-containing protein n=1 Tax=Azospirillum doebereinerae TaxID=92933 RepID=A0A433IZA7_9PROT|nr:ACT domain-containing protein [Azospirillum doebereinerae]MCG5240877.1 ACT domain-containing protein [Azospirillum doebereinerae]RUQ60155.1 ACT domain-containing protein [Azospirillum doebereinerae]